MRKITVIRPDGTTGTFLAENPDWKFFGDLVGGYIEIVPNWTTFEGKRATVYVNEEGLLLGLPFNSAASELWLKDLKRKFKSKLNPLYQARLHGNVVINQKA